MRAVFVVEVKIPEVQPTQHGNTTSDFWQKFVFDCVGLIFELVIQ